MSKLPSVKYSKRWFCYLDLLGFQRLVESNDIERVLPIYENVLKQLEKSTDARENTSYSWFSDTFIIFSRYGHPEEFASVEQAGRLFFQRLIQNEIPVRGALSFGDLYTQQQRNIFIGPALIDAYQYGEGQNWIGFILTPSVVFRLSEIDLPAEERPFYQRAPENVLKSGLVGPAYAYTFNNVQINRKNPFIQHLKNMQSKAGSTQSEKYENTLDFISQQKPFQGSSTDD